MKKNPFRSMPRGVAVACFLLVGFGLCWMSPAEAWAQKPVQNKDGSTTKTNSDGSETTTYPNGNSKTSGIPDNTYGEGGTWEVWENSGHRLMESTRKDSKGTVRQHIIYVRRKDQTMISGTTTVFKANGQMDHEDQFSYDGDGGLIKKVTKEGDKGKDPSKDADKDADKNTAKDAAKTTVKNPDGSETTTYSNGNTKTSSPDNCYGEGGTQETWKNPKGNPTEWTVKDPKGKTREQHLWVRRKNGTLISSTETFFKANGQKEKEVQHSFDDNGIWVGGVIIRYKDGKEVDRKVQKPEAKKDESGRDTLKDAAKDTAKDVGKDAAKDAAKTGGKPPEGGGGASTGGSGPSHAPCGGR